MIFSDCEGFSYKNLTVLPNSTGYWAAFPHNWYKLYSAVFFNFTMIGDTFASLTHLSMLHHDALHECRIWVSQDESNKSKISKKINRNTSGEISSFLRISLTMRWRFSTAHFSYLRQSHRLVFSIKQLNFKTRICFEIIHCNIKTFLR